jgi:hypothetical protein
MTTPVDRIPIPWPQRWELFRERWLPAACLAATLAACIGLWRQQALVAPNAIGEVHAEAVEIISPCNGEVAAVEGLTEGRWPLFAPVAKDAIVARVRDHDRGGAIVEIRAPLAGVVSTPPALPGQIVRRGAVLMKVASPTPDYIVCHLTAQWQSPPAVGDAVIVRQRGHDARWHASVVDAVGPVVEPAPTYQGADAMLPTRGLPVRIAMPAGVELRPGSVVEVRFPPAAPRG